MLHTVLRVHAGWEFTFPSWHAYTPDRLSPKDVEVDSHQAPTFACICLRCSKTNLFGNGISIYLGRLGHVVCPLAALLGWVPDMSWLAGPFVLVHEGSPLSKDKLMANIKQVWPPME